jgi:hypothetical protein
MYTMKAAGEHAERCGCDRQTRVGYDLEFQKISRTSLDESLIWIVRLKEIVDDLSGVCGGYILWEVPLIVCTGEVRPDNKHFNCIFHLCNHISVRIAVFELRLPQKLCSCKHITGFGQQRKLCRRTYIYVKTKWTVCINQGASVAAILDLQ